MTTLNVLLVEAERGAGQTTATALTAAGHQVLRCHEPSAPAFPCRALREGGHCPLDEQPVDVAVAVRSSVHIQPQPHEQGITCALRRHIPVVITGETLMNPYTDWATEVPADGDVVAHCERVAAAPLAAHSRAASEALAQHCTHEGVDPAGVHATVHRSHGRLVVELSAPQLAAAQHGMAASRVLSAVRALDATAPMIDICFGA